MRSDDPGEPPYDNYDGIRPTDHALRRYEERVPDDAVPFSFAWRNGVYAPQWVYGAFDTASGSRPTRVRAYRGWSEEETREYHSVFIVADDRLRDGEEAIVTIYTVREIHDVPTRAFITALTALEQEVVV